MDLIDRFASLGLRLAKGRLAVFPDGLGDGDLLGLVDRIAEPDDPIAPIELAWKRLGSDEICEREAARFTSPFAEELPEPTRRTLVEKIEPPGGSRRLMVLLQMWGDEGLSLRRKLAVRLAARGIGSVLPVNPFYGRRRLHRQGPAIRTVEEFLRMGLGAIEEVRSLLSALRRDYVVGLGGFSMGSGFSVGASTTLPFPVALTLMGAAPSPAKAFSEGVLRRGLPRGLRGADGPAMVEALDSVSALRRPVLAHHRRAVILAARGDGFVPIEDATALADHWRGSELRVVGGGHATLWFLHNREKIAAVERAFERHERSLGDRGVDRSTAGGPNREPVSRR